MADSPTSLLSKAWCVVMSLLGIAVTLAVIVSILQSIWPWLAAIAAAVLVTSIAMLLLRRWWQRDLW